MQALCVYAYAAALLLLYCGPRGAYINPEEYANSVCMRTLLWGKVFSVCMFAYSVCMFAYSYGITQSSNFKVQTFTGGRLLVFRMGK